MQLKNTEDSLLVLFINLLARTTPEMNFAFNFVGYDPQVENCTITNSSKRKKVSSFSQLCRTPLEPVKSGFARSTRKKCVQQRQAYRLSLQQQRSESTTRVRSTSIKQTPQPRAATKSASWAPSASPWTVEGYDKGQNVITSGARISKRSKHDRDLYVLP